jgi:sulfate permease, SulP family
MKADKAMWNELIPQSFFDVRNYSWSVFRKDLLAGLTVAVVALPLAMAFAIASGLPPERGLFTAIIAGFLISAAGGSRVQIGGPTGAFVILVSDIVMRAGYEGLAYSTLLAALFLVLMGLLRMGSLIRYIPSSLITGFTTGIAVLIFSTQMRDFLGLPLAVVPVPFHAKWAAYLHALPSLHLVTFFLGAGTLIFILLMRRCYARLPWGLAAIVFATLLSQFLHLPVETIASRFGDLPRMLLFPSLPSCSLALRDVLFDALAIAILGGIESLLSAVIADRMIGSHHRANCELVGLGIANCASVLFGGIPATGAIARTAVNVRTGAQTPMAGMIHAVILLLILLCFAPLVSKIPLAALAAILIVVAWNMSELPHFIQMVRAPERDRWVLLSAFLLTIFVDITYAILCSMALHVLMKTAMRRSDETFSPF